MSLVYNCIIILSVLIGALPFFIVNWNINQRLKLLLGFSGGYLLAVTVHDLLPFVYQPGFAYTGYYVLGGFLLQLLLEYFSQGAEHGHIHHHHATKKFPLAILISLCLHALFEGLPLGSAAHNSLFTSMVSGICLHNMPVSIAIMAILVQAGLSKLQAYFYIFLFALMTPLGALIGSQLDSLQVFDQKLWQNASMAIVVGVFLHVATTILFETDENHHFNSRKFISIVLGGLLALLV